MTEVQQSDSLNPEDVENWIEVDDEGTVKRYLVVDILQCSYKGEQSDYSVMIAEEDLVEGDCGLEAAKLTIARWFNNGETAWFEDLQDRDEGLEVLEQILAFYEVEHNPVE